MLIQSALAMHLWLLPVFPTVPDPLATHPTVTCVPLQQTPGRHSRQSPVFPAASETDGLQPGAVPAPAGPAAGRDAVLRRRAAPLPTPTRRHGVAAAVRLSLLRRLVVALQLRGRHVHALQGGQLPAVPVGGHR